MPDDDCQSCNQNVANKVLLSTVTVQDLLPEFVRYGNMTLMEYITEMLLNFVTLNGKTTPKMV